MLSLKHISKKYGNNLVLNNINIDFRNQELVAILGESGSGKSTLLNIMGGLDKYDSGNMFIDGVSTKKYKIKDWDSYRENKLGFVFQSYNLIEHLNVKENMNSSLLFRKKKNNKRIDIINKLGLNKLIKRNVKDLSGGEKQRVAIARALIKNPEILLCDEPTGALDSVNSNEIMKILKEIAKNKLVIVVTHSEELAAKYADRIVRIKDGQIVSDSREYKDNANKSKTSRYRKKRLNLIGALKLSLNNLRLRKGRTLLVSIAGSIGIIGIALIISLSSGVERYIKKEEEKTISNYPITINRVSYNYKDIKLNNSNDKCSNKQICSRDDISNSDEIIDAMALKENNLIDFKKYLDSNIGKRGFVNYLYNLDLNIYSEKGNKVNPSNISINTTSLFEDEEDELFKEISSNKIIRNNRFKILKGRYPKSYDEIVLVVDRNNKLNLSTLYKLDIKDQEEYYNLLNSIKNKKKIEVNNTNYEYDSLINKTYKLVLNTAFYKKDKGKYILRDDINNLLKEAIELKIVGIIKENDGEGNYIGYNKELLEYVIKKNRESDIYKEQISNKEINIINGEKIKEYEQVLKQLGVISLNNPDSIVIYSNNKKDVEKLIDKYNSNKDEKNKIYYVDMIGVLMETLNSLINIITYVLMALVAISLIVSSIMIAVITYISVLERSKEIGILRTMGASSKDIQRLFKTETMIEGLFAGLIGVIIAKLLTYPMNRIINILVNINHLASLEIEWMILLIGISILLTVIAGYIPARIAARRKIVITLRNE